MATYGSVGITSTNWDSSTNRDVFKTLVKEHFNSTTGQALVEYKSLYKTMTTKDDYERVMRIAGIGPMRKVIEGQGIMIDEPLFGGTKDFTVVRYGNGFRITDRMKRFNKFNLMKMLTDSLKKTMLEGKDIEVMKLWNNPTSTTYGAGFDTLALAHDTHTTLDPAGTTYDNYLNLALSNSALESAILYFDAIYDDRGNIIIRKPDQLVINKSLRFTAGQLLRSDNVAFQQSNTKNIFGDWKLKTTVMHRMSSATMWYVIGSKDDALYGPRVYTAVEPDLEMKDSPDRSRDTECTSHQYFIYGFTDPRLIVCGQA